MIRTELMLEKGRNGLRSEGKVLLVEDDPRLYSLGRMLERKHCRDACMSVVSRHEMFHKLRDLTSRGMSPVALVWSADLEEERLSGSGEDLQVMGRVEYYDDEALFGKPTLTLLSKSALDWKCIVRGLKVLLDRTYPNISMDYVKAQLPGSVPIIKGEQEGYDLIISMLNGSELLDNTGLIPMERVFGSEPLLIKQSIE